MEDQPGSLLILRKSLFLQLISFNQLCLENSDFEKISALLKAPRKILITSHANPDGDAIGASLALYGYLIKKNHEVKVMIPDPDPEFLHWMPFHDRLLVFDLNQDQCIESIEEAELIFSVDYNGLGRLNNAAEYVRKAKAARILIDHHEQPDQDFDLKISVTKTSSTSELIYDFIAACGDEDIIDRDIAECIYTGIITDTGSFSYACNYEKTYLITAALHKTGIDGEHIHRLVYDTYSENRLRLLGHAISEKLVVLPGYNAAYISLSKADLERFDYQIGDTEGVVNYALSIKDINLAALFTEREGHVKVSLRSKGDFSVNEIARKFFNGGGHANAAGANYYFSLEETVMTFLAMLPLYKDQLKSVY
jgi:bifunctional oligoribonuclease and PAP phosphatase NrnA